MDTLLLERLFAINQIYSLGLLAPLCLFAWAFYKLALGDISQSRHRLFKQLFGELLRGWLIALPLAGLNTLLVQQEFYAHPPGALASGLLGFVGLIMIASLMIKLLQIAANEFFFFKSRKKGVPLLLVNIASLILWLLLIAWSLTYFFDVRVTSVLATSAVLTIVLGLALQETLGNLFAAIALQIDKPFAMDDWIELRSGGEKIAGQVKELSWRATLLQSMTDEMITIPNRTISQWQIMNFSAKERPFLRGQLFRFPHTADLSLVHRVLHESMRATPGLLLEPAPLVLVMGTAPAWVEVKAIYACSDYGSQYILADRFYRVALDRLAHAKLPLASEKLEVSSSGLLHS